MLSDEELIDALRTDALGDAPPRAGGDRYEAIYAKAMETPNDRSGRPRARFWFAAAGVVAVATGAVVVARSDGGGTANAAMLEAAANLADVTSFEVDVFSRSGANSSWDHIRVDGSDADVLGAGVYDDGHVEVARHVLVDGMLYETIDGETTAMRSDMNGFGDLAEQSATLVDIMVDSDGVREIRPELVDGTETLRYDFDVDDSFAAALDRIGSERVDMFDVEFPEELERISVWVADEIVRQVEVHRGDSFTRTTFSNIGADFTFVVPPPPYGRSPDDE